MPIGPPIPGAPWTVLRRLGVPTPPADRTTTTAGTGKRRPFKRRVPRNSPDAERRLAGNTEIDTQFFNDMVRQGVFVYGGPREGWSITGTLTGPVGATGPAGPEGPAGSSTIADGSVTYAKIQSVTASRLLGRGSSGSGETQEITPGTGLTLIGTTLSAGGGVVGGGPTIVRKTADESVTSSTTYQSDDELLFAISASEIWEFEFVILFSGNSSGDIKCAINVPSGATGSLTGIGPNAASANTTATMVMASRTSTLDDTNEYGFGASGTTEPWTTCILKGVVVNGANAGNVQLRWAQLASNGTATTVKANSYVKAFRVS